MKTTKYASSSSAPTTFSLSHFARARSPRVSKPCSAAAADLRSSILRGHVRLAWSGAESRGAGTAARFARPQSGILGNGPRHDRVRRDAGAGVVAGAARGNGPRAREILQSQPHRSVLSAQERRAGAHSGVRRVRRVRRERKTLGGARPRGVAQRPGRGGAVCLAPRAKSNGRHFVNSGGWGRGLARRRPASKLVRRLPCESILSSDLPRGPSHPQGTGGDVRYHRAPRRTARRRAHSRLGTLRTPRRQRRTVVARHQRGRAYFFFGTGSQRGAAARVVVA